MTKHDIDFYDNGLGLFPVTAWTNEKLVSCDFVEAITSPEGWDVFIFNNPYTKLNCDLVNVYGKLYLSAFYGEGMNRDSIYYVICKEERDRFRNERSRY